MLGKCPGCGKMRDLGLRHCAEGKKVVCCSECWKKHREENDKWVAEHMEEIVEGIIKDREARQNG